MLRDNHLESHSHPLAELSMNSRENVGSVKREHGLAGRDREVEKDATALKVRIHLMIELPRMGSDEEYH